MSVATPKRKTYHLPFWVIKIFTNQKQFSQNPVLHSKLLNRLGLHVGRVLLAHFCTKLRRALLFYKIPKADRKFFNKNGFIIKENFLSQSDYQHLKEIIENAHEFEAIHPDGDAKNQKIFLSTMRQKHGLKYKYLKNTTHMNLLSYVAAKNNNFNFFMNKLISGKADPQTSYHADTFHPTMKSWLFFSDTNTDDGPFCYFPGSHKLTLKRLILEYKISNDLFSG